MEEKKKNDAVTVNNEDDPLKNPLPKEDSNLGNMTPPVVITAQKPESGRETSKIEEHPIEHKHHHSHKRRASRKKTLEQVQVDSTKRFEDKGDTKNATLKKFLDHPLIDKIFLILTFYALFADDYRLLLSPKDTDIIWDILTVLVIVAFAAEVVISCFAKLGYLLSYYFWLDIISTASLILDIIQIKNLMIQGGSSSAFGVTGLAKIIRLVRLFRLIRISKIFKSFSKQDPKDGKKKKVNQRDSKVGKTMSERATKKIIITIFLMLLILPLFNADFYLSSDSGVSAVCEQYGVMMNYSYTTKANFSTLRFDTSSSSSSQTDQASNIRNYTENVNL